MIEYDRKKQDSLADRQSLKICVAGVGGAGSNVLDRIALDRTVDADLVCLHTDVRVLSHGMAPAKVQLGADLMKGVGAGGDPDLGREAALFSKEQIRNAIAGHDIVFICTGLGGGTGSGASPVVAEIAKSTGSLVVVLATMPFSFEGRRRLNQAEEALELLQKRADALVLFENNRMGELVLPKEGIQKAFSLADQTIAQCARAVSAMVSSSGLVKLGLDDLMSALNASNGRCLFGFGEGKGGNRGSDALKKALKSPLIDQGRLLQQTKNLLVHIVGGESLTLMEVDGVMKQLGRTVPDETQILFGLSVDPKLSDAISVTLISSLGLEQINARQFTSADIAEMAPPAPPPVERKPAAAAAPAPRPAAPPPLPPQPEPPAAEVKKKEEPMELFGTFAPDPEAPAKNGSAMPPLVEDQAEDAEPGEAEDEIEAGGLPSGESEKVTARDDGAAIAEPPASPFATAKAPAPPVMDETPPPVPTARPLKNEPRSSKPVPKHSTLAAVLASPSIVAKHQLPSDDYDDQPGAAMFANGGGAATVAAVAAKASTEQQTFSLGGEDRGRFKDTEPTVADGEDLDVPTWMRLRKRLKK